LEQQVTRLKSENQNLVENLNNELEKTQRLTIEVEESDTNRKVRFIIEDFLKSEGFEKEFR